MFHFLNRFWSRSRFTKNAFCDTLVNNMNEAFNSVILNARCKPIVSMLEDIRVYMMNRWTTNRERVKTVQTSICPKIKKRLDLEAKKTRHWIPR